MAYITGEGVMSCVIRNATPAQKTMFNAFLVKFPLFIVAVYGAVYSVASDALDLGVADGVIDAAFRTYVLDCVGDIDP